MKEKGVHFMKHRVLKRVQNYRKNWSEIK